MFELVQVVPLVDCFSTTLVAPVGALKEKIACPFAAVTERSVSGIGTILGGLYLVVPSTSN